MKAHLINCTYCVFRQVAADPNRKNGQRELCRLTFKKIPAPNEAGRFCENFHQEGHDCDICWSE